MRIKPGGARGNIGMASVARAAPDGYTLVLALNARLAVNPGLFKKIPWKYARVVRDAGLQID